MKQGVLTNGRVRLLMHRGDPCFRGYGRRNGERRRKSVRGCIVSQDLATMNLVIVKQASLTRNSAPCICCAACVRDARAARLRSDAASLAADPLASSCTAAPQGDNPLPGLTDTEKPRMRGPKRASKIRKLFDLKKEDDVRKYVNTYRREFTDKAGKKHSRAPKIQRLVTPLTLQRKRHRASIKKTRIAKSKADAADYHKLLALRMKERRERRSESLAKRRASKVSEAKA
jgi:small subunit ribosomal protein S6e